MKQQIVILGSGAVAAEITSYIEDSAIENMEVKGYLEYPQYIDEYYGRYNYTKPVLGDLDSYSIDAHDFFVLGTANIKVRRMMIEIIKKKGGKFINIIHPTSLISKSAQLGEGNVINPFCMLGPKSVIGDFNLLTSGSMISHDCLVGNNNIFSTGLLCGNVKVGDDNNFGIRATVIPQIVMGNRNVIQAGMIVDKDIESDVTVFHRFKEKVIAIPKEVKL